MRLDTQRFWADFSRVAAVGALSGGGCERLSMSDEDMQARALLADMMREAGLAVEIDATGAIWGRLSGEDDTLAAAMVGSHIDTVRNAGIYDGLLGVMLGLSALRQMKEQNLPRRRPLDLVVFPTEESARFRHPTVGSGLLAGKIKPRQLASMADEQGVSLSDAMRLRGFDPDRFESGQARLAGAKSFFELHIEQGPFLESEGAPIGIVGAIAAPTRLAVEICGEYAHSGACPMPLRRDALAAAAELILAVEQAANAEAAHRTVGAVTLCRLKNESINVVPGRVELAVDVRGIDTDSIGRCCDAIRASLSEICARRKVAGSIRVLSADLPVRLSGRIMAVIEQACLQNRLEYRVMPSGAGHDAMNVASLTEAGLIFIPCRGGVSHNPAEAVDPADVEAGFMVLSDALLTEANG